MHSDLFKYQFNLAAAALSDRSKGIEKPQRLGYRGLDGITVTVREKRCSSLACLVLAGQALLR